MSSSDDPPPPVSAFAFSSSRGGRGGRGGAGRGRSTNNNNNNNNNNNSNRQQNVSHTNGNDQSKPSAASASSSSPSASKPQTVRLTSDALRSLNEGSSYSSPRLPSAHPLPSATPSPSPLTRSDSSLSTLSTASASSASSVSSSSSSLSTDCLLCFYPISQHYCVTGPCVHSLQLCSTCIIKMKIFMGKKKSTTTTTATISTSSSDASSTSSSSSSPTPSTAIIPVTSSTSSSASSSSSSSSSSPSPLPRSPLEDSTWKSHPLHCPFCRIEWRTLIISSLQLIPHPSSSSLVHVDLSHLPIVSYTFDSDLSIYFDTPALRAHFTHLRSIYCPICDPPQHFVAPSASVSAVSSPHYFLTISHLESHLSARHSRYLCEACVETRQIFVHQHEMFTKSELLNHFKMGTKVGNTKETADGNGSGRKDKNKPKIPVRSVFPSESTAISIDPHPFCEYCNRPFFSLDELYVHLTQFHRYCRFCKSNGIDKYYRDGKDLLKHYAKSHFICTHSECHYEDADSIAFPTEMSLKNHSIQFHMDKSTLSKGELKKLQTLELGFFGFEYNNRGGGGGGGGEEDGGRRGGGGRKGKRDGRRGDKKSNNENNTQAPSYNADDSGDDNEENFPSLPSNPNASASSSLPPTPLPQSISSRVKDPNEFPALKSSSATPSSSSHTNSSASLSSSSSSTSSGSIANRAGYYVAPSLSDDFPSLPSAKNTKTKDPPSRPVPPPHLQQQLPNFAKLNKKSQNPLNINSSSSSNSTRTKSSSSPSPLTVPLPLPPPVPSDQLADANRELLSLLSSLSDGDEDKMSRFKSTSGSYRTGELSCSSYYNEYCQLFPSPSVSTQSEQLLMKLLSLLPDESKRIELHNEYAKQKVWSTIQHIKGKQEIKKETEEKEKETQGEVKKEKKNEKEKEFTIVEKPKKSSKKSSFPLSSDQKELRQVDSSLLSDSSLRPLAAKSSSDSPLFSLDANQLDKEAAERREDEARKRREKAEKTKKEKEEKEKMKEIQQAEAVAAAAENDGEEGEDNDEKEEEEEDEGEEVDEENENPLPSSSSSPYAQPTSSHAYQPRHSRPKKAKSPSSITYPPPSSSPRSVPSFGGDEDDENENISNLHLDDNPSLPSISPLSTSFPTLDQLSLLSERIAMLNSLLPPASPSSLSLLLLFDFLQSSAVMISSRHQDVSSLSNRRFHLSNDTRRMIKTFISKMKPSQLVEFSRLSRFGLLPSSIQQLSQCVSLANRYGISFVGEWIQTTLSSMTSNELFLFYEYLFHLLWQATEKDEGEDRIKGAEKERDKDKRMLKKYKMFSESEENERKMDSSLDGKVMEIGKSKEKEGEWPSLPVSVNLNNSSSSNSNPSTSPNGNDGQQASGANGGGKKKGKQVLFKWG